MKWGTDDARQSLSAAVQALTQGKVIVLHPDESVTRDPDVQAAALYAWRRQTGRRGDAA